MKPVKPKKPFVIVSGKVDIEVFSIKKRKKIRSFYSDVETPVCMEDICELAKLRLFWDENGNYCGFKTPKKHGLTKIDHRPFSESDYKALDAFLRKDNPPFENMEPVQLVDGITGATVPELKSHCVPGAVFTTYTLWQIAHSQVPKALREKLNIEKKPAGKNSEAGLKQSTKPIH
ncbi:hypothetical protein [Fulvitalea axinellae]